MPTDEQFNEPDDEGAAAVTLDEMIKAFNQQLASQERGMSSVSGARLAELERIYIPGQITSVKTPGVQVGVNYKMAHTNARGLLIIIQRYSNMRVGDWIEVFWGDDTVPVASDRLQIPEQIDQVFPMYVPSGKMKAGVFDLWCKVTRAGGGNEDESKPLSVLTRLIFPGGTDPEPGKLGHSYLSPPKAKIPPSGVIGEEQAKAGVEVEIEAYPNMREYDQIRLSWGGESVLHDVQPAEVGAPVLITVSEATIRAAGDSDALVLSYRVTDEVHNQSSDWSERSTLKTKVGVGQLPALYIVNPDPDADPEDVIDLDALGDAELEIEVDTPSADFARGDVITVTWLGSSAHGETTEFTPPAQVVSRVGRTLRFSIPNDKLFALGGGRGVASLVRTRGADDTPSNRSFVSFAGVVPVLPKPDLLEATEGNVDPKLAEVTVQVPAQANLMRGDIVTLTWLGARASGTPLLHTQTKTVTTSQAGKALLFYVQGADNLAPLDGGTLDLSYQLVRRDLGDPLDSEHEVLRVGEAREALPAPSTRPLVPDGKLDPDAYPRGIEVIVLPYTHMTQNQDMFLEWISTVGPSYYDDVPVNPGHETSFEISPTQLRENDGGAVRVGYRITELGQPDRYSGYLELQIGAGGNVDLPAPEVLEALDGILNPIDVTDGATVRVLATADLKAGDEVEVFWDGDKPGGVTSVSDFALTDGGFLDLTIDYAFVIANVDGNVNVRYTIYRVTGAEDKSSVLPIRVQSAALPLPTVFEAREGNINPDDVVGGATVVVEALAKLRERDVVTVKIISPAPGGSTTIPVSVPTGGNNQALRVGVPYAVINASSGATITLEYSIDRAAGGPPENSPSNTYSVSRVIGVGLIRIFGARYGASTYRASGSSRIISAFNSTTDQPILVEWQYAGDVAWTAGYTWLDRQPQRPLRVRSTTDAVWLNPANVVGNGTDSQVQGMAAYAVMLDNPTPGLFSLYGWGAAAYGANVPPTMITYDDVVEVSGTRSAFAARLQNGSVACWGNAAEGGTMRPEDMGQQFLDVRSNNTAFVGRLQVTPGSDNGRLTAWGVAVNGATVPPEILALTDITAVFGSGTAFAAQRANGRLVAWGSASNGGVLPPDIAALSDIQIVKGNFVAFAARRANKRVVAWGHAAHGGTVPASIAARTDIETLEGATALAFSVLTTAGQVLAWGEVSHGGTVPAEIAALSDIVEVTSTWHAFCARRRNGHVVAWGNATNGGTVPADIAQLSDIVQVTGSAWSFAALRRNGTVVAWGQAASGGDTSAVAAQLTKVRAVYANSHGFTALTRDGRVVTWGNGPGGGDSSAAQPVIGGRLLTGRPDPTLGAIEAADNELRDFS
ncbi:hypothetical protein VA602_19895 [Pseudomonas sp. MH2]|uniref:Alpha-tubulin suppressor n=1 Tax=Pseudomonas machongensis TaxID=3110229 RepID=A0ABU5VLB1_9PSED|nr:hypothetical protein [Pseudomonas sp. MH2]MEA5673583.1 hypothetical protein [Pseudomonas sp. MH2]